MLSPVKNSAEVVYLLRQLRAGLYLSGYRVVPRFDFRYHEIDFEKCCPELPALPSGTPQLPPPMSQRARYIGRSLILIVLLGGMAGAGTLYWYLASQQRMRAAELFFAERDALRTDLTQQVEATCQMLTVTEAFFNASTWVTEEEFTRFARQMVTESPSFQMLVWLPGAAGTTTTTQPYVFCKSAPPLPGLPFIQRHAAQIPHASPAPTRKRPVAVVVDSAQPSAPWLLVRYPMPESPGHRAGQLYLVANLTRFLETPLRRPRPSSLGVELQLRQEGRPTLVYFSRGGVLQLDASRPLASAEGFGHAALKSEMIVPFFDRPLRVRLLAAPAFMGTSLLKLLLPTAVALVSLLLAAIFYLIQRRDAQVLRLVEARTTALDRSNQSLAREIMVRKQAEFALRTSQERYQAILEGQTELICRNLADGTLSFVNEAFCRFFGHERHELLGRSFFDRIPPEDRLHVQNMILSLTPANPTYSIQHRVVAQGGEIRWMEWNGKAILDNEQNIVEYQAVGHDITALHQALDELQQFAQLVQQFNALIALTTLDGTLRYVNHAGWQLLGCEDRQEALERGWRRVFDDGEPDFETVRGTLQTEAAWQGTVLFREHPAAPRRMLLIHGQRLAQMNAEGGMLLAWTARDITAEQQGLLDLGASERRYREMVELAQEGIWVIDAKARTTFVNEQMCLMLGYAREEMLGASMFDFMTDEARKEAQRNMERRSAGIAERHDFCFLRKNGTPLWVSIATKPLQDDAGTFSGAVGMLSDITDRKLAEEALQASEARYKSIVEHSRDAIILSSLDGRPLYFSPASRNIFGCDPGNLPAEFHPSGVPFPFLFDAIHPDDRPQLIQAYQASRNALLPGSLVYRMLANGHEQRWISHTWTWLRDQKTTVLSMLSDITRRHQAETALKQTAHELQRIFEMVPLCIWKFDVNDNQIVYLSDSYEDLTGLPRTAILSNPSYYLQFVDGGEESQQCIEAIRDAIRQQLPFHATHILHSPVRGPRHLLVMGRPAEEAGKLVFYGTIIDVTQQRLAENERRLLAMALEQAAEGVLIIDASGRIEYVNQGYEKISGLGRAEVLGRELRELISSKNPDEMFNAIWNTVNAGHVWRGHFPAERKSGERFELLSTISPVYDANHRLSRFVVVQLDITHEISLERRLLQAERLGTIGQTITGVAHNLKNILAGLRGSIMMLDKSLLTGDLEDIDVVWNIFKRNTERLTSLAETMLDYTRMEEMRIAPAEVNHMVAEAIEQARLRPQAADVTIEGEFDASLPTLLCDGQKLHGAILNLLTNATDACMPVGQVWVTTRHDSAQQMCLVQIADNGPGIAPENIKKIFDPFFTTKGKHGMGMGLSLTQKVIHEHGGTLEVQSRPGQTVFSVRIPLLQSAVRLHHQRTTPSAAPPPPAPSPPSPG
jgi:PAS domain S-box-containing protein